MTRNRTERKIEMCFTIRAAILTSGSMVKAQANLSTYADARRPNAFVSTFYNIQHERGVAVLLMDTSKAWQPS
jgi:hypothetical protein